MNIDEMKAGSELDALIAEKVMGLVPCDGWAIERYVPFEMINLGCKHKTGECYPVGNSCAYSTNIEAAWSVVEKLVAEGFCPSLVYDDVRNWALSTEGVMEMGAKTPFINVSIEEVLWCESAPLAICRAALKAVGVTC